MSYRKKQRSKKSIKLLPGDKVLIVQDAWESLPDFLLVATKGSIARALSLKEYCDHFNIRSEDLAYRQVSQWMAEGKQFPFMFVEVAPPSKSLEGSFYVNDCQIGKVVILDARFFQKLSYENIDDTNHNK